MCQEMEELLRYRRDEPEGDGYLEFRARASFHDLCAFHGFEEARRIVAEIINDEAEGGRRT